eukprot:TCALIF_03477-PA protein Name:"Protein of unknown function" AED:0.06 eAED:0.07 QI:50/0.75/0.4/1/1/1/5/0/469
MTQPGGPKVYSRRRSTNNCSQVPKMKNIKFSNIYWQKMDLVHSTIYLLGAYYDSRMSPPLIRVIFGRRHFFPVDRLWAQMWFQNGNEGVTSRSTAVKYLNHGQSDSEEYKRTTHEEYYEAFMADFPIPNEFGTAIPLMVSLVENECDQASNLLKVIHEKPIEKRQFAICTRTLFFPKDEVFPLLMEWIEMNLALGVSKILVYILNVGPKIQTVLEYYKNMGVLEYYGMTWPGANPQTAFLQHDLWNKVLWFDTVLDHFAFHDCLYRHLYSYEASFDMVSTYLSLLDVDEIIMPVQGMNWKILVDNLVLDPEESPWNNSNEDEWDSLLFRHFFFFGNQSKPFKSKFRILNNDLRSKDHFGYNQVKGFFRTRTTEIMFNHYPVRCVTNNGSCQIATADPSYARLNHYRNVCQSLKVMLPPELCEKFKTELEADDLADRFAKTVMQGMARASQHLLKRGISMNAEFDFGLTV